MDWKDDALFSDDPLVRLTRARAVSRSTPDLEKDIRRRYKKWLPFWHGAANAWLVYLGPSPGNSPGRECGDPFQLPVLGKPHPHLKCYSDARGFWNTLREWTLSSFGTARLFRDEPDAALGVTLNANVLPTPQGDASRIDQGELDRAMPHVADILNLVKPRLLVPLHKKVSKSLLAELKSRGAEVITGPNEIPVRARSQSYEFYKPKIWEMKLSRGRNLLVAESPQHPSKRNFIDMRASSAYLGSLIRDRLRTFPSRSGAPLGLKPTQ